MLLTITSTTEPATDLGFLLHKNPAAVRTVDLAFGKAHVFYPEATADALHGGAPRRDRPSRAGAPRAREPVLSLADYVNDRPYVASSFMSVAIAKLFGTALSGRSDDRPELADTPIPLEAHLPAVPCRGGDALIRELFEPLGYEVQTTPIALDAERPDWGDSRYLGLTLRGVVRLRDLLRHLYVLLPVMDDDKHYWVERGEIDKLLAKGEEWLAQHPSRELITRRFLKHRMPLMREALARLTEDVPEPEEPAGDDEGRLERTTVHQFHHQRHQSRARGAEQDPQMGAKLYRPGIRQCIDLNYASAQRQTIWEYAPRSRAAEDYNGFLAFVDPGRAGRFMPTKKKSKPLFEIPKAIQAAPQSGWVYRSGNRPSAGAPLRNSIDAARINNILEAGALSMAYGMKAMSQSMVLSTELMMLPWTMTMSMTRSLVRRD